MYNLIYIQIRNDMAEDILCVICLEEPLIPFKLTITNCDCVHKQIYCKHCIEDFIKYKDNICNGACPTCRKPFSCKKGDKIYEKNVEKTEELDKIGKISCPCGCKTMIFRKDIEKCPQKIFSYRKNIVYTQFLICGENYDQCVDGQIGLNKLTSSPISNSVLSWDGACWTESTCPDISNDHYINQCEY